MTTRLSVTTELLLYIVLLALLQTKHLVADFFLQSAYMIENRQFYGHPGGLAHVGMHALGSALVFLFFGGFFGPIALILVFEFLVHYHVDWAKDRFVRARGLTPTDRLYWIATGTDQALHQFTYLIMAAAWVMYAWNGQ